MNLSINQRLQINRWRKYHFHDPATTLHQFRALEHQMAGFAMDVKVRELRTNRLKKFNEERQIALFCHGIGTSVVGTPVYYAAEEAEDYDAIVRWQIGNVLKYAPLQVKEWVPAKLNPNEDLSSLLKKLQRYPTSKDTIVAIHMNRPGIVGEIRIPKLNVAAVWLFAGISPDVNKWMLFGDLLKSPQMSHFDYPN